MGAKKTALDSIIYSIAIIIGLFFAGLALGITHQFGQLLSITGVIVLSVLIFSMTG